MSEDVTIVEVKSEYRLGVISAKSPHDVIVQATAIAEELAKIVKSKSLATRIQGREYVRVEGWSTMGAMLGVLPRETGHQRFDDGSYEAEVDLIRISDNAVIGHASARVGADEKTWGSRPEYARLSMAITRATGKAYRLGFSWIMALAGYEATPAEEMEPVVDGEFHEATPEPTNEFYTAWVQTGVVRNVHHAKELNEKYLHCSLNKMPMDDFIKIGKVYRGWRDTGLSTADAAAKTLAGEVPA